MGKNNFDRKVLVIGIDGATWDLLKPWIEREKLPTLKKIMENGLHGVLDSTIPPLTGPVWVSFATGKNPGKHGCYDFFLPENTLLKTRLISTEDINSETFYEMLEKEGKRCIIINLPISDPPKIKGIVIASFSAKSENFIFPPDLVKEIKELRNYPLIPDMSNLAKHRINSHINNLRILERGRFNCTKILFRKRNWDFFFVLFSSSDWVQHLCDKLFLGTLAENSEPAKVFIDIDSYVGWLLDNVPKNTNIFVVSDHGFRLYEKKVSINRWLIDEGYLQIKSMKVQSIPNMDEKALQKNLMNLNLPKFLLKPKLFKIESLLFQLIRKVIPLRPVLDIEPDLSHSVAFAMTTDVGGFSGIHINVKGKFIDGIVEPVKEYELIRNEIMAKLRQFKDPKTGKSIFEHVLRKEDVYWGEFLEKAPDIIIISDKYDITKKNLPVIFDDINRSHHSLKGILIAYGVDIKKGLEITGARIYDIAPTIMHIFGIRIPKDIDGRVLTEIFKKEKEFTTNKAMCREPDENERMKSAVREENKPKQVYTLKEQEEMKKRLKGLGYL